VYLHRPCQVRASGQFRVIILVYYSSRRYSRERRPSSDGHMVHLASSRLLPRSAPLFHPMLYSLKAHITLTLVHYTTSRTHCQKKAPGTSELLIVSPMIPKYTVHQRYLNTSTTVTVEGFDARSLQETTPRGAAASASHCRNRYKVGDRAKLWPKIADHASICCSASVFKTRMRSLRMLAVRCHCCGRAARARAADDGGVT
jgi:hypothetical protein